MLCLYRPLHNRRQGLKGLRSTSFLLSNTYQESDPVDILFGLPEIVEI